MNSATPLLIVLLSAVTAYAAPDAATLKGLGAKVTETGGVVTQVQVKPSVSRA